MYNGLSTEQDRHVEMRTTSYCERLQCIGQGNKRAEQKRQEESSYDRLYAPKLSAYSILSGSAVSAAKNCLFQHSPTTSLEVGASAKRSVSDKTAKRAVVRRN